MIKSIFLFISGLLVILIPSFYLGYIMLDYIQSTLIECLLAPFCITFLAMCACAGIILMALAADEL